MRTSSSGSGRQDQQVVGELPAPVCQDHGRFGLFPSMDMGAFTRVVSKWAQGAFPVWELQRPTGVVERYRATQADLQPMVSEPVGETVQDNLGPEHEGPL